MSQPARLRELLERLVQADVRFVLVGGLAVNAWGYVRGTQDVDLVPDPAPGNLERLVGLLQEMGGRVEVAGGTAGPGGLAAFLRAGDRTLVATDAGYVDVLQGLPQVPRYAELEAEAVDVEIGEVSVRVCSLNALLAMKRASTRARDRDDVEALEAANEEGDGPSG